MLSAIFFRGLFIIFKTFWLNRTREPLTITADLQSLKLRTADIFQEDLLNSVKNSDMFRLLFDKRIDVSVNQNFCQIFSGE